MNPLDIRQRDRGTLRDGYNLAVRRFELASISAWGAAMTFAAVLLAPEVSENPLLALCGLMLGFVAADFISGFVHWAADTWGSPEVPVIGNALIRPFREHHVDQTAITRHDFVETNGNNCFISIPAAALAAVLASRSVFFAAFLFSLTLAVFGTNQFHKWAHMDPTQLNGMVRALQRSGLILSPAHHVTHHTAPFSTYYCITHGMLNPLLARTNFFRHAERVVGRVAPDLLYLDERHKFERVAERRAQA
jgi:hypothetical protein